MSSKVLYTEASALSYRYTTIVNTCWVEELEEPAWGMAAAQLWTCTSRTHSSSSSVLARVQLRARCRRFRAVRNF